MRPEVRYFALDQFAGWDNAIEVVRKMVSQYSSRRILEVGSGANPVLPIDYIQTSGIEYTANDVSEEELMKAHPGYQRLLLDLSCASFPDELKGRYDFIFSRMVNEHIRDGERYYRNIHDMLSPGGITAHWFSTLYALPFLINRLLPDKVTDFLLDTFSPRNRHQHEKFRAYYSWSRGPSPRMIRRFEGIGFKVLRYDGYFGHGYYALRLPWLHKVEMKKMNWLVRHPQPWACSYAHIVLQRPGI
jgi:2-polyprenyl-3-methyl-5-hydroxy-6-metoxy-1,4-benzoquinol methylase